MFLNVPVPVEIDGVEYSVRILTLGDCLNSDIEEQLEDVHVKAQNGLIEEYRNIAYDIIAKYTNIPKEVLSALKPVQLELILLLILGESQDI